jgi:hypothetical protein
MIWKKRVILPITDDTVIVNRMADHRVLEIVLVLGFLSLERFTVLGAIDSRKKMRDVYRKLAGKDRDLVRSIVEGMARDGIVDIEGT